MGNADYIWEQIGVWFAACKWMIVVFGLIVLGGAYVWRKLTNAVKVFCAGIASLVIFFVLFSFFQIPFLELMGKSAGFWNFIILVVSAPVAFAIWHFRDENNRQQIENQRKDINLKEFQKLSEWVSGAHLPEIKMLDKTTQKEGLKDKGETDGEFQLIERTTEKTEEYGTKPHAEGFDTFGKREGAVALQISAVYNLLPFFRGDYGESFRRPAFNLLKSAWQAMQQRNLNRWEEEDEPGSCPEDKEDAIIDAFITRAYSPMGVALTHVLLSLNRKNTQLNLRDFPEMLSTLCLVGMNFHLSGVDEKTRDWSGLNLSGVDFRGAYLKKVHFEESQLDGANLQYANLQHAYLSRANLQYADLRYANLPSANLRYTDLLCAKLQGAFLIGADLQGAKLDGAELQNADLRRCALSWEQLKQVNDGSLTGSKITEGDFKNKIYPGWKAKINSEWEAVTEVERMAVMQRFHDETKMYVFREEEQDRPRIIAESE